MLRPQILAALPGDGRNNTLLLPAILSISYRFRALTARVGLCNFSPVVSHEFHAQPTCAGAQPALAGSQCLHGPPGADAFVSRPRPRRAEPGRRFFPDF